MTDSTVIRVAYSDRSGSGSIAIEQESWGDKIGKVTKLDLINTLSNDILGTVTSTDIDCGTDDDGSSYCCVVYAYPSPPDLLFNMGITSGSLDQPRREEVEVTELISFKLTSEENSRYPTEEILSFTWGDFILDGNGSTIQAPEVTLDGDFIILSSPVYAVATITYKTVRYVYTAKVVARDDSDVNVFQSVVYATWDGGVELESLGAPPNAEESYSSQTTCEGNTNLIVDPDEPEDDNTPKVKGENETVYLDYCKDF